MLKEDKTMRNVDALNNIKNAAIRNYDFIEACEMLESINGERIAIVDDNDGYCLDIIEKDDITEFM